MVRNGWAMSDNSAMDAWSVIARENRRGLWGGKFVDPQRWRLGNDYLKNPCCLDTRLMTSFVPIS